jgi:hypothetical protein
MLQMNKEPCRDSAEKIDLSAQPVKPKNKNEMARSNRHKDWAVLIKVVG